MYPKPNAKRYRWLSETSPAFRRLGCTWKMERICDSLGKINGILGHVDVILVDMEERDSQMNRVDHLVHIVRRCLDNSTSVFMSSLGHYCTVMIRFLET
jgi:hypothetical protein